MVNNRFLLAIGWELKTWPVGLSHVTSILFCRCKSDKSDDDMSAARSSHELYVLQNSLLRHDDRIETIFSEKPVKETNSRFLEGTGINSHQSRAESGGSITFHEVVSTLVKMERFEFDLHFLSFFCYFIFILMFLP